MIFFVVMVAPLVLLVFKTIEDNPGAVVFAIVSLLLPIIVRVIFGSGIEFLLSVIFAVLSFFGVGGIHRDSGIEDILEGFKRFFPLGLFGAGWAFLIVIALPILAPIMAIFMGLGLVVIVLVVTVIILGVLIGLIYSPIDFFIQRRTKARNNRIHEKINLRAYARGLDEAGNPISTRSLDFSTTQIANKALSLNKT